MAERGFTDRLHRSVFSRLVVIMVALAASLLVLVSFFFWFLMGRFQSHAQVLPTDRAHVLIAALVLLIMACALFAAHGLIRRLLHPLRGLSDGVARLSEGQLDVTLPTAGRDEFGALTEAFNTMVTRVRAQIQARDQLLLDVSHELRSPLTRMRVALELMPDGAQRAQLVADVAEMEQMVAGLLELERRRGTGVMRARRDLAAIVREAAAPFERMGPGVRVVAPLGPVPADVDAEQVRTVLRNLLDNAVKYSRPNGRPVDVTVETSAGAAIVSVADDGVGIPEEDLGRVFEPFFRVDRSRTKTTGGFGLGLSICKRIMEAHGGTIVAVRRERGGTAFVMRFPAG